MSVSALPVVLQCDRLAIGFAERTLVEPFDWSVREGERWAVLGANGSGKTSLLHALLGASVADQPQLGAQITLMGTCLAQLSVQTQARWRVWVPQRYEEPFTITVLHALQSVAASASIEVVLAVLTQFGLQTHARAWVHQLSGGERQRLTWAMAALRAQLSDLAQPVMVATVDHVEGWEVERTRGFVVPHDWTQQAAARRLAGTLPA